MEDEMNATFKRPTGEPPWQSAPTRTTRRGNDDRPRIRPRSQRQQQPEGIPPKYLIGAAAVCALGLLFWYLPGMGTRLAEKRVAGISPADMLDKLMDGDDLPDNIPLEVEGILDTRVPLARQELVVSEDLSGQMMQTGNETLHVFGLLFPSECKLIDNDAYIRSHAKEVQRSSNQRVYSRGYTLADAYLAMVSSYNSACGDKAILVQLQEEHHGDVFEAVRDAITLEEQEFDPGDWDVQLAREAALEARLILASDNLQHGVFTVQLTELDPEAGLDEVDSGYIEGVEITRTVVQII